MNAVISIVSAHQRHLSGHVKFHLAEFKRVTVDNMVRNPTVGR